MIAAHEQLPEGGGAKPRASILICAPYGRDGMLICDQLAKVEVASTCVASITALCDAVNEETVAMIVAEETLIGSGIDCLTHLLSAQAPWSDIPVILLTGGQSPRASARVVTTLSACGNLTLLERPVRVLTMVSAVHAAQRARRKQYQVRDLLQASERSVRQRDQFLAMLGHELRNPIGTIRNAIEVLDAIPDAQDPDAREHRAIIRRQARHMGQLIDDLLDVSRVTTGKITLHKIPLDVRDLVRRCVQALAAAIETERHQVTIDLDPEPLIVTGDPVRLEQVVTNLLTNAIKYTPTRGELHVSARRSDGKAIIRVKDNGLGIAPELLPFIFDLFTQGHRTLDRAHGGLGIGLTVVKSIVNMHEGVISVHSEGPRKGSTFLVELPLSSAHLETGQSRMPARARKRRVLIVEDIADARKALRVLLQLCGHAVETAEDGLDGVEKAIRLRPEVAVIDIGLPKLDGYQVAEEIRAALGREIFLVALTGYGQPDDQSRALTAGFDCHLTKPVDPERLFALLDEARGAETSG